MKMSNAKIEIVESISLKEVRYKKNKALDKIWI